MTTDLAILNASVASLDPANFLQIIAVRERIAKLRQWLTQMDREAEAVGVKSLEQHGAQVIGEVRWYAAVDRDMKCRDLRATAEAVMEASKGDWDAFCGCLSANAFKPGACRSLFDEAGTPDRYEYCFQVIEKPVMRDGKPGKSMQSVPLAFLQNQ